MTDRDPRVLLARLVDEARRRANRRVLAGALAAAALPALAVVLVIRLAAVLAGAPVGPWAVWCPAAASAAVVAVIVTAAILHRRRRLDTPSAALLLDRRAGTRERCVTGIRVGGVIAEDALRHVDRETVRRAMTFRPPRTALAAILVAAALAAVWFLPGTGETPAGPDRTISEVVLPGGSRPSGGAEARPPDAEATPEISPEAVSRLVDRAAAALPESEAAREIRDARQALRRGDEDGARRALERALARVAADEGGEDSTASRRIRRALEAAAGAARRSGVGRAEERVDWGGHAPLVGRYHLALDDLGR